MPVLKDYRDQVKLTLPVTKGHIWIYDCILAKDSEDIDKVYVTDTDVPVSREGEKPKISIRAAKYYEALDKTVEKMVVKWDYTDEKGKAIEPTIANIKRLPKNDYQYLLDEINKRVERQMLTKEQKKKT